MNQQQNQHVAQQKTRNSMNIHLRKFNQKLLNQKAFFLSFYQKLAPFIIAVKPSALEITMQKQLTADSSRGERYK
jgi:hypothetical protein